MVCGLDAGRSFCCCLTELLHGEISRELASLLQRNLEAARRSLSPAEQRENKEEKEKVSGLPC